MTEIGGPPPEIPFALAARTRVPLICVAMYPCSNPELVAASAAGALLRSVRQLKRASLDPPGAKEYMQTGMSVAGISAVEPVASIVARFEAAARASGFPGPPGC